MTDPRLYQIGTLASLLIYGMGWLDFDVTPSRVLLLLSTVLVTQAVCDRLTAGPARAGRHLQMFATSARSALISGLSLCLLLRTNRTDLAVLAAVEIGHLGVGFAKTVEEMQHGLAARG